MAAAIRKHSFRSQGAPAPAPTVSAGYAGNLMQYALSLGADPEALAERSGITVDDLRDPDGRIPLANYAALMRASKTLCQAPALALHLGARQDFKDLSVVGLICYAAPTMGEALMELNRYGRLVAEVDVLVAGGRFQMVPRDGGLWLTDMRADPDSFPEMTEATWSRFIAETRRHFPDAPFAKAVHVTHPAPSYAAEYERVLLAPVTFGSDRNAILIDASWLGIPLHNPSRYAFGVLSEHADRLMKSLESAKTMRGRVESLAAARPAQGRRGHDRRGSPLGPQPPDPLPQAQGRGRKLRGPGRRPAPPDGAALSERPEDLGERDGLSGGIFRPQFVLPGLQALDGAAAAKPDDVLSRVPRKKGPAFARPFPTQQCRNAQPRLSTGT